MANFEYIMFGKVKNYVKLIHFSQQFKKSHDLGKIRFAPLFLENIQIVEKAHILVSN